jgi:hypothetical protein
MDVLRILHKEEHKLLQAAGKIEGELSRIRAAINALGTNSRPSHKLKGKKLSAAHRRAIREGIRKAKAARK